LNYEKRTGVKDVDFDEFVRKASDVEAAIRGMMYGSVNPDKVKIEGIDTEEEKQAKEEARLARLAEIERKSEHHKSEHQKQ